MAMTLTATMTANVIEIADAIATMIATRSESKCATMLVQTNVTATEIVIDTARVHENSSLQVPSTTGLGKGPEPSGREVAEPNVDK